MKIFIAAGGGSLGPYTVEEIRQSLRNGDLSPSDLGCREGDSEWTPISQLLTGQPTANAPHVAQKTVQPIPVKQQQNRAVHARPAIVAPTPTTPVKLFAAAFLAIVIAGGCLMAGWQLFLRDKTAKPSTLSAAQPASQAPDNKQIRASLQEFLIEAEKVDAIAEQISSLSISYKNADEDFTRYGRELGEPNKAPKIWAELQQVRPQYDSQLRVAKTRFEYSSLSKAPERYKAFHDVLAKYQRVLDIWGDTDRRFVAALEATTAFKDAKEQFEQGP